MHELSIAQNVLDIIRQNVPEGREPQAKSVLLRVGDGAGIVAESLEFCFHAMTDGTPFHGMVMNIERAPFIVECGSCKQRCTLDSPAVICPLCFSGDIRVVSGTDLQVVAIELADETQEVA
jgi:hydrogenase nickel incorporation protein HypA/HybF